MTLVIDLSEKLDAAIKAQALATGVSEAQFVQKILEQVLDSSLAPIEQQATISGLQQPRPLSARIRKIWSDLSDDVLAEYPEGGAGQIDHHVYGLPKQ